MILGEAAEFHRSAERTRVLDGLKHGPLTVGEIKAAAEIKSRDAADKLLQRMAEAGQVERIGRGKYGLPVSDPKSEVESEDNPLINNNNSEISWVSDTSDTPSKEPREGNNGVRKSETQENPCAIDTNPSDTLSDTPSVPRHGSPIEGLTPDPLEIETPEFLRRPLPGERLGPPAISAGPDDDLGDFR